MVNTYTEKLGLAKPANGDIDWHIPINGNWDELDSKLGPLYEDIEETETGLKINKNVDNANHDLLNVNNFSASTFKTKQCVASSDPSDLRVSLPGTYSGYYAGSTIEICRLPPFTLEPINSFELSFTLTPSTRYNNAGIFYLYIGGIHRFTWETWSTQGNLNVNTTIDNVTGSQKIIGIIKSSYNDSVNYASVYNIEIRAAVQDRIIDLSNISSTWVNW